MPIPPNRSFENGHARGLWTMFGAAAGSLLRLLAAGVIARGQAVLGPPPRTAAGRDRPQQRSSPAAP